MQNVDSLVIPGISDPHLKACIARSRRLSQYIGMVQNALADPPVCPFCEPLDETKNRKVEGEGGDHWNVIYSSSPEKNTRLHFLIIPKRHVASVLDLTAEEWIELWSVYGSLCTTFELPFRGILIRDGDATQSAGTIWHLHIHVMVPDGKGRVESPFCKTAEEEQASLERAIVFEKIRQEMKPEDLPPEEFEKVKGKLD